MMRQVSENLHKEEYRCRIMAHGPWVDFRSSTKTTPEDLPPAIFVVLMPSESGTIHCVNCYILGSRLQCMSLDIEPPTPPAPSVEDGDTYEVDRYRHRDLLKYLEQGAWEEAFNQWALDTGLTEQEYTIARELDLFADFEFMWDDAAGVVDYRAPEFPEDWREREIRPDLDSVEQANVVETELDDLGDIVAGTLTVYYVEWEDETDAFGPQYNAQDDSLSEEEYSEQNEFFE